MIDEDATFKQFGYKSTDLKPHSHKKIVAVCDRCGKIRLLKKQAYRDLCFSCVRKGEKNHFYGKTHSEESIRKMSESHKGKIISEEQRKKLSKAGKDRRLTEAHRKKIGKAQKGEKNHCYGKSLSEEQRKKLSVAQQGIPYDEWEGFATESPYCPKFNEACRESNREKYSRRCFICGKHELDNTTKTGKVRKLSVHHVDMDKMQGCDGHRWRLIPTCLKHHGKVHSDLWMCRIIYLLENVYSI